MRKLFVGGPGRSGTSFFADRLGQHPQVVSFADVELKFFTEKNGLLDLWHALGQTYSPNRAVQATEQFRRMVEALITGQYGQLPLSELLPASDWRAVFDRFLHRLMPEQHPLPQSDASFFAAAAALLDEIVAIGLKHQADKTAPTVFLEKTPHALLSLRFLTRLAPGASYVHVMRDPRSIANSLGRMTWGPKTPGACCAWVASYCERWAQTLADAKAADLPVTCFHIEAIAETPAEHARETSALLGIDPAEEMFARADLHTLNAWAERSSEEDLEQLTNRLGHWIDWFGYDRAHVGRFLAADNQDPAGHVQSPAAA